MPSRSTRPEENFSFDEHLLERISVLEEVLKRTTETVRNVLTLLQKQEKTALINNTGLETLADQLEGRPAMLSRDDWNERLGIARTGAVAGPGEAGEVRERARRPSPRSIRGRSRKAFVQHTSTRRSSRSSRSIWTRRWRAWRQPTLSIVTITSWPISSERRSSTKGRAEEALVLLRARAGGS